MKNPHCEKWTPGAITWTDIEVVSRNLRKDNDREINSAPFCDIPKSVICRGTEGANIHRCQQDFVYPCADSFIRSRTSSMFKVEKQCV